MLKIEMIPDVSWEYLKDDSVAGGWNHPETFSVAGLEIDADCQLGAQSGCRQNAYTGPLPRDSLCVDYLGCLTGWWLGSKGGKWKCMFMT